MRTFNQFVFEMSESPVQLKRLNAGLYETIDGKYRIEKIVDAANPYGKVTWHVQELTRSGWQAFESASTLKEAKMWLEKVYRSPKTNPPPTTLW